MDLSFVYKAYCDEAKATFLCLMQKKKSQIRLNLRLLAEMVGFEPKNQLFCVIFGCSECGITCFFGV